MPNPNAVPAATWNRIAWACGLGGLLCYFGAAFIPVPDTLVMLMAFAFGPLLAISFLAVGHRFAAAQDSALLRVACFAGMAAGILVTTMLVVQVGNNMARVDTLAEATTPEATVAAKTAWRAVNRVQYLVDVVWDIYICLAVILLGADLIPRRGFGPLWGGTGMLFGLGLLVLNLWTFPYAPGETGLVDLGPLVALWMGAFYVRMIVVRPREAAG